MNTNVAAAADLDTLLDLNRGYIRAVQATDVAWFDANLADDFLCTLPDGSLLDRAAFLLRTAAPVQICNLDVHDVIVKIIGEAAIVHARTSYVGMDGRPGSGRYTDVWAKRDGRWLAVAAQFTRS